MAMERAAIAMIATSAAATRRIVTPASGSCGGGNWSDLLMAGGFIGSSILVQRGRGAGNIRHSLVGRRHQQRNDAIEPPLVRVLEDDTSAHYIHRDCPHTLCDATAVDG